AGRALARREDLDRPALPLRVAAVHTEEVGGEERGLLSALPSPDLEDDVLLVVRVGRKEQELDLALERPALRLELRELELRELPQLRIGESFLVLFDLLRDVPVTRERAHERLEVAPLLRQLAQLISIR